MGGSQYASGSDEAPSRIQLERMKQQQEVRNLKDDWTGVTNPAERRKLQNRLNQRIYRKRRAAKAAPLPHRTSLIVVNKQKPKESRQWSDQGESEQLVWSESSDASPSADSCSPQSLETEIFDSQAISYVRPTTIHHLTAFELGQAMQKFELLARRDHQLGSPRTDQLLTLIQYNVLRALFSNTEAMGFGIAWMKDEDAISPYVSTGDYNPYLTHTLWNPCTPPSLLPTELQRTIPHHPWIDLFPIPTMRDNLLLAEAGGGYDEWGLCNDLVDFCDVPNDQTGLVVWKEPWNPSGWEVSEAFVRKWGWVVKGCGDLLVSTNFWRERRGEERLVWEL